MSRPPTSWRSLQSTGTFWSGISAREPDAGLQREIEPFRDVGIDEDRERVGRIRRGLGALLGKALPRLRQAQHAPDIRTPLRDNVAWASGRREQSEPAERLIVRQAGFGDGRKIRKQR